MDRPEKAKMHIEIPAVSQERWALWFLAGVCMPIGLSAICFGLLKLESIWESILLCLMGIPFLITGVGCVVLLFVRMHLVPEGIAWILGSFALRRIPIEEVKFWCIGAQYSKHGPIYRLGISRKDIPQLARLREAQLLRNPYMRTTVPRVKRSPLWQEKFAGEYIGKKAQANVVGLLGREIVWNAYTPELMALLKTAYPHVKTRMFPMKYTPYTSKWADRDPNRFCRGKCKETDKPGVMVAWIMFTVSPLLLVAIVREPLLMALLPVSCFGLIFGILWYLLRGEYDVLQLEESGIRVMRSGREYSNLPREEIRTLVHVVNGVLGSDSEGFIAVTGFTPEQVREKEMAAMNRTENGRMLLEAWKQTPGWEQRLFARHCVNRINQWGLNSKDYITVYATARRIQILREKYPEAEWIDVSFDRIAEDDDVLEVP